MVDDTREVEVPENALAMSDEDIMNMPEPTDEIVEPVIEDTKDIVDDADEEAEEDDETDANDDDEGAAEESELEDDTQSTGELEEEGPEEVESGHEPSDDSTAEDEESKPIAKKAKGKKKKNKTEVTENEISVISSDDLIKELFTPFRANGKDMQVSNINDARTLMQMGANYNKKMAGLNPNLKLMKMLGNNDLLDESKLNYLIDLSNKNPEAIAKLIKDSGVDPLDIDTDSPIDYKPNSYTVNDKEVDLDSVLEDISDTPSFDKTINIISNKLDDASKRVLLDSPELIPKINEHVATGVYGQIMDIIEQERTLGRLTELSDLDAYQHVGDVLDKQGAFNKQPPAQYQAPSTTPGRVKDPKLNAKKRAASGTKSSPKVRGKANAINPLELSDEDFMRDAAQVI